MWSIRNQFDGESTRRKFLWDKTQRGGTWWLSEFRDGHDGSVVSRPRHIRDDWNLEGSVFDKNVDIQEKEAVKAWLADDTGRGVIRIYEARLNSKQSTLVLCTTMTTAQQICLKAGLPLNALHYQLNGDVIRRLEPHEYVLQIQTDYLKCLGFDRIKRIQEEGASTELADFVKFYAGKPYHDATFSRQTLAGVLSIRKQKGLYHPWCRRLCEISGTERSNSPEVLSLVQGKSEIARGQRGHEFCLKVTGFTSHINMTGDGASSTPQTSKTVYLAFDNEIEMMKWSRKCNKAITKQPDAADLSNNHLEFLPENLFINENLTKLSLRHNALKERPIEEDIYTIGWIDDLPRFQHLRSLNLASNDLRSFPVAVCKIRTLVELNMSSNKLEDLPPQISELSQLRALHLQANHLRNLPSEMRHMKELKLLVLAFNHFTAVPCVVADMKQMDSLILAGNFISRVPDNMLLNLRHIRKLDLRMNQIDITQDMPMPWECLRNVTHIDLRDNQIPSLDLSSLTALQFLNCQRSQIIHLQLSGVALGYLNAADNKPFTDLEKIILAPIPANLVHLDLSHNSLTSLPNWIGELRRMETLICNFNHLTSLPNRLFQNVGSLRTLIADHNRLTALPDKFAAKCQLETLLIHQNKLTYLPDQFLSSCHRLKVLNVSNNRLFSLPAANTFTDHNRIQELFLAANHLQDETLDVIAKYPRLRILNLAHNDIHNVPEWFFVHLELIEELNFSGNQLCRLPDSIVKQSHLQVLKLHSNKLQEVPDFSRCSSLRTLDIGANELKRIPLNSIMGESLKQIDVSFNKDLKIDRKNLEEMSYDKQVILVDIKDAALDSSDHIDLQTSQWKVGFAQTPGNRNKLCTTQLRVSCFDGSPKEALFGIFDGGFNNEIPSMLSEFFPSVLCNEKRSYKGTDACHLKYAFLLSHIATGVTGQRTGVSAVVCHMIQHSNDEVWIYLANVGHTEAVLCRGGEPVLLSRKFLTTDDREECERIRSVDGIITEDSLVNGSCVSTRMIGASYLFPAVIPEPHCLSFQIRKDDSFVIIASKGIWDVMTHREAVNEVCGVSNTIIAAKKLIDIAQSYGARGNLSVIVVSCQPIRNTQNITENLFSLEGATEILDGVESDDDFFPESNQHSSLKSRCVYPRSASQILIMDEQIYVSRSAQSLTEAVEPEENYYFQHRRAAMAEALSSGSSSPDMLVEKTVLLNGDDFEVHESNAHGSDMSGNTLSGHMDSALGSSVNPSVSGGNGSPVNPEPEDKVISGDNSPSGAVSHCDSKSHDEDAVHSSDPMDDEECRSWQFLMNEALADRTENDDGIQDATLEEDPTVKELSIVTVAKSEIPRPPTPPDPKTFFKTALNFRVVPRAKPIVDESNPNPKRNKILIDELETVLKKRLSQIEETMNESVFREPKESIVGDDKLIRPVKSTYQTAFRLTSPSAFLAQNYSPQNSY